MKGSKEYHLENSLAATRVRLGITQVAMALELGISNSLLSRAEHSKRNLPTEALAKLSSLEIKMAGTRSLAKGPTDGWTTAEKRALVQSASKNAESCRAKALKLQPKLDDMMDRYDKLHKKMMDIEAVLSQPEALPGIPQFSNEHLEKHRDVLEIKLWKVGRLAQAELRNKIALLHAEAHLHEADILQFGKDFES